MRNHLIKSSRAKAPGKLILSGEHAVVYQQPAIAIAVNKHVTVNVIANNDISIHFLENSFRISCQELPLRIQTLKNRYAEYQQGRHNIKDIFHHPSELILLILDYYNISQGLEIQLHSELPIGCGMGTSAAVILACFIALNDYFDVFMYPEVLYQNALTVENFQHGKSSGLDVSISQLGNALFIEQGNRFPITIHIPHFFAINTGQPISTTGQCVDYVKRYQHDTALWQSFSETTYALKQALENDNILLLKDAIKKNHRLLHHIGVVPEKVQEFIRELETLGFAGKISGAGSIQGDNGGMVIAIAENPQALQNLCERFQYTCSLITGEPLGARTY